MSKSNDIKTQGIALRRTNYGEADRIVNLITPIGKISAIAKGVRKPRSKLAGGVEMFTLSDLQIHRGRSELGVVTSARMVRHYSGIMKNYDKMQLAGLMLKRISQAAETVDGVGFFELTVESLVGLDDGVDNKLVEAWFWLNLMKIGGEEVNLYRDADGDKLAVDEYYEWNVAEEAFMKRSNGEYGADEIKLLRLMVTMNLATMGRVKIKTETIEKVLRLSQIVAKV